MSGFAGNDAVVGEGVLSSRITHAKLGAEARGGDLYIFFWWLTKNIKRIVITQACRLVFAREIRWQYIPIYCFEERARHGNALWVFFKISGI